MSTISPRKDDQGVRIGWQVRIRKQGYPAQVKTFRNKAEAQAWAKAVETEMERGIWRDRSDAERTTVADLLDRYAREVLPNLKGGSREQSRIGFLKADLGHYSLAALSSMAVAEYRDKRLSIRSGQTVKHELGLLQRALKKATMEWGIALPAGLPTAMVKMPKVAKSRDRRLVGDEEERLFKECRKARSPWLLPVVRFAIETAMRAGEILETKGTTDKETGERPLLSTGLLWKHVDLKKQTALLPKTKNGEARTVPLSSTAMSILKELPRSMNGKVFDATYEAVHLSFDRACNRAGIKDLRFHDLRHEATSRLFEKGLNPMQVSSITGHKTLQMLKRYTHLRAEDLVELLG